MRNKIRRVKLGLSEKILAVLGKSMRVLSSFDSQLKSELEEFPDGFVFSVDAGGGANVMLKVKENRLIKPDINENPADLTITFKDITGAFPALIGGQSIAAAYAQHRMTVRGSINRAVMIVRLINIAETYILPGFILKKTARCTYELKSSRLAFYGKLIFAKEGAPV